jgi:predicted glycosyltransferase
MPAELRRDLAKRARGLPVRVRMSVDDTLSYLEAADLVVAMAGYNTTIEILRSGRRAILIPRAGPSAEQRTRASLFSARHWVEMIDPDDLDPGLVARKVIESLGAADRSTVTVKPDLDGTLSATEQLLALLPVETEPEGIRLQMAEEYLNGLSF